jgi:hypothetical protein
MEAGQYPDDVRKISRRARREKHLDKSLINGFTDSLYL